MASLNQSSSSETQQKSLYMFFRFHEGESLYALYHYIINTTYTKHQKPLLYSKIKLNFDRKKFPIGMGCISLDSKVYFIGGQFERDGKIYNSKTVCVLDLDTIEECFNEGKKLELIEGPKMHSGKSNTLVVEVAGKIYVLALPFYPDARKYKYCDDFYARMHEVTEEEEYNYEVFDSKSGQWTVLPNHPFSHQNYILGHVVVGDIIYFLAERKFYSLHEQKHCVYCFDTQKQKWVSTYDHYNFALHNTFSSPDYWDYNFHGRGIVVNDTLYALGCSNGAIKTYYLSKYMEENSFLSDAVRGLEFSPSFNKEYEYGGPSFVEAYLVHLGDEKFCLVSYEDKPYGRRSYRKAKRDVNFTTFQVIKQKSHGENFLWADIVDSYAIEEIDANLGRLCYCFTA